MSTDSPINMTISTDNPEAVYQVNEKVTFHILVERNQQPVSTGEAHWQLKKDGGITLQQGVSPLEAGRAEVSGSLSEPGFLHLHVTFAAPEGQATAMAGAGIDPLKISPSLPVPKDFDTFWDRRKAKLAEVPLQMELQPLDCGLEGLYGADVRAACVGAPVRGYLARPANAEPGSLPAILTLHGAGVNGANWPTFWAEQGFLALDINAHGIPNGQPAEYYNDLAKGELADYRIRGRQSRSEFYFLGMFLRVIRAIDVLTAQPEWNGRHLVLYGTSQGAAQSYAGAALDKRVTFFVAGVAAMADLTGFVQNRATGWPGLGLYANASVQEQQAITYAVRYFDAVNMATRVQAEGFFTVGFIDQTCPPTAVYAAYNNVKSKKAIFNDVKTGHANSPEAVALMRRAVLAHVGKA
ncbi:MAG: acetylxylan esterase [Limnochordia bacterium]